MVYYCFCLILLTMLIRARILSRLGKTAEPVTLRGMRSPREAAVAASPARLPGNLTTQRELKAGPCQGPARPENL